MLRHPLLLTERIRCWYHTSITLVAFIITTESHFSNLIPGLKQLPPLTFWLLPTAIALPFLVLSLSRFAPKAVRHARLDTASKGGI